MHSAECMYSSACSYVLYLTLVIQFIFVCYIPVWFSLSYLNFGCTCISNLLCKTMLLAGINRVTNCLIKIQTFLQCCNLTENTLETTVRAQRKTLMRKLLQELPHLGQFSHNLAYMWTQCNIVMDFTLHNVTECKYSNLIVCIPYIL